MRNVLAPLRDQRDKETQRLVFATRRAATKADARAVADDQAIVDELVPTIPGAAEVGRQNQPE